MTRDLYVLAPPDVLIDLLDEHDVQFHMVMDSVTMLDHVSSIMRNPPVLWPVLAYGANFFGPAATGRAASLRFSQYPGPRIALVDTVDPTPDRLAAGLLWRAAHALRVNAVVDLSTSNGLESLRAALAGETVPGITAG